MKIDDFLNKFIEGYLLHDLNNMGKITLTPSETAGGCGYPMVATTLAGIEILGYLLVPDFNPYDNN